MGDVFYFKHVGVPVVRHYHLSFDCPLLESFKCYINLNLSPVRFTGRGQVGLSMVGSQPGYLEISPKNSRSREFLNQ